MARRRNGIIRIDVEELLDQVDDENLIAEVQSRKLIVGSPAIDFVPEDDLREAYVELLRGRPREAMAILDRMIHPKWNSAKACETALRGSAMSSGEGARKP